MTNPAIQANIKRYHSYLQDEIDDIYIYETLAILEQDKDRRNIHTRLVSADEVLHTRVPDVLASASGGVPGSIIGRL